MGLVSAGGEVAARWLEDPAECAALVLELMAGGGLGVDEVLDAAVDGTAVCGLLALGKARTAAIADPSAAAELCLAAVPHFAHAVALASADLG